MFADLFVFCLQFLRRSLFVGGGAICKLLRILWIWLPPTCCAMNVGKTPTKCAEKPSCSLLICIRWPMSVWSEESVNWMQGITCLKGCGASIEDIKEYCDLCRQPESRETLCARYQIILRQREQAYKRIEEAKATAAYMDEKVQHYQQILSGLIPDDSNPQNWTDDTRPEKH